MMKTSRREFLKSSALAGMASVIPVGSPLLTTGTRTDLPFIPYGAVYFRKSNPPGQDWERDYKQAVSDGMNAFRHWFMWSAIEVSPGKYDWDDYDRQLDLAAKHGIRTIVAEILGTAPQWAFRKFPHALIEEADGSRRHSHYTPACAVGGWPGLCLDNEDVKKYAEEFLTTLVERYKNHPGMGGYDLWNELNQLGDAGGCFCDASAAKFREWLQQRYRDLNTLNKAWYRYSYASWDDVMPPRTNDPYPDSMDWNLFRIDNAVRLLSWKVDLIRNLDDKNPITAHAIPLGTLDRIGKGTYPVFQAGKMVDIFGYSGGGNHEERSRLRWQHWAKMDMTRSAAKGKPFWCAEMASGASWRARYGWEVDRGRITSGSDVKLYSLMNLAGGARGIFSPRWRPLQDGRFMGSFAFYDMDGSPTERSRAASFMAKWANDPARRPLLKAKPVRSDIGILVVPESQIHCYVSEDNSGFYYRSINGAYQGFLFNNIQPDFVHIDDLNNAYDLLYLPYPVMLSQQTAERIKQWVQKGGRLIAEGCPAYFGDHGRAGTRQPHYGLDELFGVEQEYVQFTPDLLKNLIIQMKNGDQFKGGIFLQSYLTTTGVAVAHYTDNRVAVVDNTYGKGRTRLVGSFPGYAYSTDPDEETRRFFGGLVSWADKKQNISAGDERVVARLQTHEDNIYLWVSNVTREDIETELFISTVWGQFTDSEPIWGEKMPLLDGNRIKVSIPARDMLIMKLGT